MRVGEAARRRPEESLTNEITPSTTPYPDELTETALLDDGTAVCVRGIRPDDAQGLERLFYRLSPQSLYLRFFSPVPRPNAAVIRHLVTVDYRDRLALVAVIEGEIVGVARYDRLAAVAPRGVNVDPGDAEAAVIVEDAWQGRGIATRLLWRLSAAAAARGIATFTASVLGENRQMIGLLRVLGKQVDIELHGGEYEVRLHLASVTPPGPPAVPDAAEPS